MHRSTASRFVPVILFSLIFILGIFLSGFVGLAWDEPDNIYSGGQYLKYVLSGFDRRILESRDHSESYFSKMIVTQEPNIAHYPPIPNYVGTGLVLVGERIGIAPTTRNIIIFFHLATAFFFGILVASVYELGILLGFSLWVSLTGAIFTTLYPTLFGYGFSDIKDTAQVAMFTLGMYFLVKATLRMNLRSFIVAGTVWGMALATKFNTIYIPIIWILWSGVYFYCHRRPVALKLIIRGGVIFLLVGLLVTIVVWPYLWYEPITHISAVVRYFISVGQGYTLFWNGMRYKVGSGGMLWWYPWANLLLVSPILILVGGALGVVWILRDFMLDKKAGSRRLILIFWIFVPISRSLWPNAAFYDGIRHFLEILPPLLLLAAYGCSRIITRRLPGIALIVTGIIIIHLLVVDITYFPYSTGYFNILAPNPNVRFDRDIEGLSVSEAIDYLHSHYGSIHVWVPIGGHLSWYYLTDLDKYETNSTDADSIVLVNKSSHASLQDLLEITGQSYELVGTINRGGAIFASILRKR